MGLKKKRLGESPFSKQCVTLEPEDRLSSLPEEIRRHIVSLLPIQDAVRTTILSRQWSHTCYSLPNLIFEFRRFPDVERKLDCFVAFIDQMILRYDESGMKTFKLIFWVENESYTRIDNAWITFAMQRNVENLILGVQIEKTRKLPSCIFTSKSLTKLHLAVLFHVLKLPTSIDLPNLKELALKSVILADEDLPKKLFSSCPALETLGIDTCGLYHLEHLAVSALNLKHLQIYNCDLSPLKFLAVSALNLKILQIYKCSGLRKCEINLQTPSLETFLYEGDMAQDINLGIISSIYDVGLCFKEPHPGSRSDHSFCSVKVLRGLCNMTKLLVSEWFIEYLFSPSSDPLKHLNATSFNCLRYTTIFMCPVKQHAQTTAALLTRFLNLHTLTIVISGREQPPNMSYLEMKSQDLSLVELLNHLEFVEIHYFKGHESELEIVEFLLNNAKVLVEMKIKAPRRSDHTDLPVGTNDEERTSVNNKLLAFRRASSRAKISFSQFT